MIELNKIYCENCLDTMSRMPDNFIDLTVTSPPYDDMDDDFNPIPKNGMRTYNDYSWDFKRIAQELYRVTKQNGVLVWVVGDQTKDGCESLASFKQAIYFVEKCRFKLHDKMIYRMKRPPLNHSRYEQEFDFMFIFCKDKVSTFNPLRKKYSNWTIQRRKSKQITDILKNKNGIRKRNVNMPSMLNPSGRIRGNIWLFKPGINVARDKIAFEHPAIFPEKLARDHIYSWSNEGNLIYDPFMGSGTVAKMAHLMKRNWIGSEISQEYVDLANKRIDPYLRQQALAL